MPEEIEFHDHIVKRITQFGLPEWLGTLCPVCSEIVPVDRVMALEVFFVPMFVGDIAFSYHCAACNAAFIKHLQCDAKSLDDVSKALNSGDPKVLISQDELFRLGRHNLRDSAWN